MRITNILCLLATALLAGACKESESAVDRATREGILLMGNTSEPRGLDPHIVSGVIENNIIRGLFEGLVVEHPSKDGVALPGVAEPLSMLHWKAHWRASERHLIQWPEPPSAAVPAPLTEEFPSNADFADCPREFAHWPASDLNIMSGMARWNVFPIDRVVDMASEFEKEMVVNLHVAAPRECRSIQGYNGTRYIFVPCGPLRRRLLTEQRLSDLYRVAPGEAPLIAGPSPSPAPFGNGE